eukprot:183830-Prorocentrum_minimum.AAC.1
MEMAIYFSVWVRYMYKGRDGCGRRVALRYSDPPKAYQGFLQTKFPEDWGGCGVFPEVSGVLSASLPFICTGGPGGVGAHFDARPDRLPGGEAEDGHVALRHLGGVGDAADVLRAEVGGAVGGVVQLVDVHAGERAHQEHLDVQLGEGRAGR